MTKKKLYFFVLSFCIAGCAWILLNYFHSPITLGGCLFYKVTHIPCPSCGSTRSIAALLHGNIQEALYYNPIGIVLLLFALVFPAWVVIDLICKRSSFFVFYNKMELFVRRKSIVAIFVLLILSNWIWNFYKYL